MKTRKLIWQILLTVFLLSFFVFSSLAHGQTPDRRVDSLNNRIQILENLFTSMNLVYLPQSLSVCGESVPLERSHVYEKFSETIRYLAITPAVRQRISGYLVRAGYYFPYLDSVLAAAGLCSDLKYIPIVESEFNPRARSRAGAVGIWQIMPRTGRRLGLNINSYIDERRDFEGATAGALRHLAASLRIFGRYDLAISAYNVGDGAVQAAIRLNNDSLFFNMVFLRRNGSYNTETMDYYYRVAAVKVIVENAVRYYFEPIRFRRPFLERISYTITGSKSVVIIARELGVAPAAFVWFNPQIIRPVLPRGRYEFSVPRRN